eukprot:gene9351-biopygen7049
MGGSQQGSPREAGRNLGGTCRTLPPTMADSSSMALPEVVDRATHQQHSPAPANPPKRAAGKRGRKGTFQGDTELAHLLVNRVYRLKYHAVTHPSSANSVIHNSLHPPTPSSAISVIRQLRHPPTPSSADSVIRQFRHPSRNAEGAAGGSELAADPEAGGLVG